MLRTQTSHLARVAAAIVVASVSVACAAPATSPTMAVERAFDAYKTGNKGGVNDQLSRIGHVSADFFCRGDGWDCLAESYHRLGQNLTSTVEATRQTNVSARVVLKTTWSKYPTPVCQEYSMDYGANGWGITYIDLPKRC